MDSTVHRVVTGVFISFVVLFGVEIVYLGPQRKKRSQKLLNQLSDTELKAKKYLENASQKEDDLFIKAEKKSKNYLENAAQKGNDLALNAEKLIAKLENTAPTPDDLGDIIKTIENQIEPAKWSDNKVVPDKVSQD